MPLPDPAADDARAALWLDEAAFPIAGPEGVTRSLALDEALLEEAHEQVRLEPVVRVWMAARPVVVVGSSSRVEEEVDVAACRAADVGIVRRPSGGATVILGPGCLMWSVVSAFPEGAPPIEAIHAAMLGPLVEALRSEGLPAARLGTSDLVLVPEPERGEEPPRKISGNALRVRRQGVLYHGTLLDDFDIPLAERLLRHPPREPGYRGGRRHGDFLTNLRLGRDRLEGLVRRAFGASAEFPSGTIPQERVERLLRERYADSSWTHRL